MKTSILLDMNDIRTILAHHFGTEESEVVVSVIPEYLDGPYPAAASISASVSMDKSGERPVVAQQTVVQGGAVFGPTTIVMPRR